MKIASCCQPHNLLFAKHPVLPGNSAVLQRESPAAPIKFLLGSTRLIEIFLVVIDDDTFNRISRIPRVF